MRLIGMMAIFLVLALASTGFTFADFTGPEVKAVTRVLMMISWGLFIALVAALIFRGRNRRRMAKEDE
jgi:hypothetical protein